MMNQKHFIRIGVSLLSAMGSTSVLAGVIGSQTEVGGPKALCRVSVGGVFQGSGTLIEDNRVLTAAHVVAGERAADITVNCNRERAGISAQAIRLADTTRARAGVKGDPLVDFAVIELVSKPEGVDPLPIAPISNYIDSMGALKSGMYCELAGFGPDRIERSASGAQYGRWDSLSPIKGPLNSGLRLEGERLLIKERSETLPSHELMRQLVSRIDGGIRSGSVRGASAEVLAYLADLGDRTTYAAPGDSGGPVYCFEENKPWTAALIAIVSEQSPSASDSPLSIRMRQTFVAPELDWLK